MRKFAYLSLILAIVSLLLAMSLSPAYAEGQVLLSKVASSDNVSLGDNITYTYTITNNSTDNLTDLKLVDDKLGDIVIPDRLSAGDNITVTASHIVSSADYAENATELTNIATLTSSENITATDNETVSLIPYNAVLEVSKEAYPAVAQLGDVITYTYNIRNIGEVELDDIVLNDNKLGNIPLISDNLTAASLLPGENITAAATYTVVFNDLLAGSIKNTATVTGVDPNGKPVTGSSTEVTVSTNIIKLLLTKAQVLTLSGVPGKGINTAPGLQKPFNPNSQASEHAGKKDGKGNLERNQEQEQNQHLEMNGNSDNQQNQGNGKEPERNKNNN